jgi:hypothetical protein
MSIDQFDTLIKVIQADSRQTQLLQNIRRKVGAINKGRKTRPTFPIYFVEVKGSGIGKGVHRTKGQLCARDGKLVHEYKNISPLTLSASKIGLHATRLIK